MVGGDFDGDGKQDLVVGEPERLLVSGLKSDQGALFTLLSSDATVPEFSGTISLSLVSPEVGYVTRGLAAGERLGSLVRGSAADVNADGLADLIVGAAGTDGVLEAIRADAGRVLIVTGAAPRVDLPDQFVPLVNSSLGPFVVDRQTGTIIFEDGTDLTLLPGDAERWYRFTTQGDGLAGNSVRVGPETDADQTLNPISADTLRPDGTVSAAGVAQAGGESDSRARVTFDLGVFRDAVVDPTTLQSAILSLGLSVDAVSFTAPTGLRDFVSSGGKLFFTASDGAGGRALWVSDGTFAGTIAAGSGRSNHRYRHDSESARRRRDALLYGESQSGHGERGTVAQRRHVRWHPKSGRHSGKRARFCRR